MKNKEFFRRFLAMLVFMATFFVCQSGEAVIVVPGSTERRIFGLIELTELPAGYHCYQISAGGDKYVLSIDSSVRAIRNEDMIKCGAALKKVGGKISKVRIDNEDSVEICELAFPWWIFDPQGLEIEFLGCVSSINARAFDSLTNVKLSILANVGNIRKNAFFFVNNMEIIIKGGVYSIEENAFNFCPEPGCKSVTIEKSIVNMANNIFGGCGMFGVRVSGYLESRLISMRTPCQDDLLLCEVDLNNRLRQLAMEKEETVLDLSAWL